MSVNQDRKPYNPFCLSSSLAFRYVARANESWTEGVTPEFPHIPEANIITVSNAGEVLSSLQTLCEPVKGKTNVGILLSGGIDSAILASLLGKGTPAFTIRFIAEGAVDESIASSIYAKAIGLNHHIVDIHWQDYLDYVPMLMKRKKATLHAVEVGLYKAAKLAKEMGIDTLVLGNGADSTFGGLDKLLSVDWTFDAFMKRYTFLEPSRALKNPVSMVEIYEPYKRGDNVDVSGFLKTVHGLGVVQAFENAITAAGCKSFQPYEDLVLGVPLDMQRIRGGESKYILREIFQKLYAGIEVPPKVAFARPMDVWMKDWKGPKRNEFISDLDMANFNGEQKWLMYCLDTYLNILDGVA